MSTLKHLEELEKRVVNKEWRYEQNLEKCDKDNVWCIYGSQGFEDPIATTGCCCGELKEEDAELICLLRNALPKILALREKIKAMEVKIHLKDPDESVSRLVYLDEVLTLIDEI